MPGSQANDVKLKVVEAAQGVLGVASAVVKPVQHCDILSLKKSRHSEYCNDISICRVDNEMMLVS